VNKIEGQEQSLDSAMEIEKAISRGAIEACFIEWKYRLYQAVSQS